MPADGEEEEEFHEPVSRKRSHAFTITGAIMGLLVGLLLVIQVVERKKEDPAAAEAARQEELKDALQKRKAGFVKAEGDVKAHIESILEQARRRPAEGRRELLTQYVEQYSGSRWGHLLAAELVKLGPAPKSTLTRTEEAAVDEAYKAVKAEAQKLRTEGKLGDAIGAMMKDYQQHKVKHDAEISAFVESVSGELTKKWEESKRDIERRIEAGDADGATALLRSAQTYGDEPIRREVNDLLEGLQARAAAVEADKAKAEKAEDADEPATEKADEDELSGLDEK